MELKPIPIDSGDFVRIRTAFRLDRAQPGSLRDQLADRLRSAIARGIYREGDVLPSLRTLAQMAGTSLQVSRAALRILQNENAVCTHPRIGTVVLPPRRIGWKGRILAVVVSSFANYYQNVFYGEIERRLVSEHYRFVRVFVPRHGRTYDFSLLDAELAEGADLVFLPGYDLEVNAHVSQADVRTMVVSNSTELIAGETSFAYFRPEAGLNGLAERCRSVHVREVLQITYATCALDAERSLKAVGIPTHTILAETGHGELPLEGFMAGGYAATAKALAKSHIRPDTLVFYADDFLALGGLLRLSQSGLVAPRDLRLATFANAGFVPPYASRLTCILSDPVADAVKCFRRIVRMLAGGKTYGVVPLTTVFTPGDTL